MNTARMTVVLVAVTAGVGGPRMVGAKPPGKPDLSCKNAGNHVVLCDDFESGRIDSKRWKPFLKNGGALSVDTAKPYEGKHSLHVRLQAPWGAHAFLRSVGKALPIEGNHFFGRAFLFISPLPPHSHGKLLSAEGPYKDGKARYGLDGGAKSMSSRYASPAVAHVHGGLKKVGGQAVGGQWRCVEWEFNGPANSMRYWMDGQEVDALTVTGTEEPKWAAPRFETFQIGYAALQPPKNGDQFDIYWDAVALSRTRMGCGR